MLENFNISNLTSSLKNQSQFAWIHPKKYKCAKESQRANWHTGYRYYSLNSVKTALFNIEHDKSLRIMVALQCS